MSLTRIYNSILLIVFTISSLKAQTNATIQEVNYKYAPSWWQTLINQPESARKSVVGKNGELMYEFPNANSNQQSGFGTVIRFSAGEKETWANQQLYNARIPMLITRKELNNIKVTEETFAVAPLLFGADDNTVSDFLGTWLGQKVNGKPGNDIVIITYENKGNATISLSPELKIITSHQSLVDTAKGRVFMGGFLRIVIPHAIAKTSTEALPNDKARKQIIVTLKAVDLEPGKTIQLAFGVAHGYTAIDCPNNLKQALYLQKQSVAWWENVTLPYNNIVVPDTEIQNLLDASIRNIYQVAERENNMVILKSGPSSNRKFSVNDAPFIVDALTMLGEDKYAREAMDYLLSLQKADGSFSQQDKDWKQTGMVLWAISNYARLTGDKQWLETSWPKLEKGFNYLMELQKSTLSNSKLSYSGLIPPGADGDSQGIDFVNNYWVLAGLNSAITAARWGSRNAQAIKWQSQYDDYYKAFLEATPKYMKKDAFGNSYLPARASAEKKPVTQKMQWTFLNALYPGKIFDLNNPIVTGNMKMLEKTIQEGLLVNTGLANNMVVLSAAVDYAHALQWTGKQQEALNLMYALANHASPNYAWFEQQSPQAAAEKTFLGDMPNSRVSADFIRLVRHLMVMERSNELHLFEGVPTTWTRPGMEIKLDNVLTDFGLLKFYIKFSDDGTSATLEMNLDTNNRRVPQRIVLHLDGIAGNPATMELELKPNLRKVLKLN